MDMNRKKKVTYSLVGILIAALLGAGGWFYSILFENEKPLVNVEPLPQYLARDQKITVRLDDRIRGLRNLKVSLKQQSGEILIHEQTFPFIGLLNKEGTHHYEKEFTIDPISLKLVQGQTELIVQAWDYSRVSNGSGNLGVVQHSLMVDTTPPSIQPLSQLHYINKGGTGLVIYQAAADTLASGVFVNDRYFPGFPAAKNSHKDIYISFFSIPPDTNNNPRVYLWAKDQAANENKANFAYHIRPKKFRQDKINISDAFLTSVLPYFSFYLTDPGDSNINQFLKINKELRKENHAALFELSQKSDSVQLWQGPFLRFAKSSPMAGFGDRRSYFFQGKKMDEQTHLGVDLASVANARVEAANNGRVIYADRLGIYGNAVVIDHGQGISSLYGHLSKIDVQPNQEVKKGDLIGHSGQTGLAVGDHLHFSILVNGVFVDPLEWWDAHWIQDNITAKLQSVLQ
jgi:murein DD-endopeptidase MepM/ murein hydrolase activator NlpD